jgi:Kinesin motor domain
MDSGTINERIKVFIRQRPNITGSSEKENALSSGIKSFESNGQCSYFSATGKKSTDFQFEGFLQPSISQSEVYELVGRPIVESALKGYPGTIFAYGPTNSGKTHTIRGGSNSELGIMPR